MLLPNDTNSSLLLFLVNVLIIDAPAIAPDVLVDGVNNERARVPPAKLLADSTHTTNDALPANLQRNATVLQQTQPSSKICARRTLLLVYKLRSKNVVAHVMVVLLDNNHNNNKEDKICMFVAQIALAVAKACQLYK